MTIQHSSAALAVETLLLVMPCHAVPALEVEPPIDDHPIGLLQYMMTMCQLHCPYVCQH